MHHDLAERLSGIEKWGSDPNEIGFDLRSKRHGGSDTGMDE